MLSGLWTTFKNLFHKKVTSQFPEQRIPQSARFRGLHALRRYENGSERCIGCKLCEAVCPAMAITIVSGTLNQSRGALTYEIDLFKCIYCGLCEEACPVDAIVETSIIDYAFEKKEDAIINKEKLLAIGDQYEMQIRKQKELDAPYR